MNSAFWISLLRFCGRRCPINRGKSRIAKLFFRMLRDVDEPFVAEIVTGIEIELWPWLWADFATYTIGTPELYSLLHFKSLVTNRMTVFDVGAYLGVYAFAASQIGASVHAFEPDPRSARRLSRAIKRSGLNNIRLQNCAVEAEQGMRSLSMATYPPQSALGSNKNIMAQNKVDVEVVTIDDYCRQEGLMSVDIMKIDTEGAELRVLRGAEAVIMTSSPILFLELHEVECTHFDYNVYDTLDFLARHNYVIYELLPGLVRPKLAPFFWQNGAGRKMVVAYPGN